MQKLSNHELGAGAAARRARIRSIVWVGWLEIKRKKCSQIKGGLVLCQVETAAVLLDQLSLDEGMIIMISHPPHSLLPSALNP